jgi:Leucine-rich repeat (LRR) protein
MEDLMILVLRDNEVQSIKAVKQLYNLRYLNINGNQLTDLSPISKLDDLVYLKVDNNQIRDIAPIYNNEGFRYRGNVFISGNPLNEISLHTYLPELEKRKVRIEYQ